MRRLPLVVVLVALPGCHREPGERNAAELETVEVGGPIDAGLSTENDVQADLVEPRVSGVLPGSFPRGLPLYVPSGVIGFGEMNGRRFVRLHSPDPAAAVGPAQQALLTAAGWSRSGESEYLLGGRRVWVVVTDGTPGSEIRVEYPGEG